MVKKSGENFFKELPFPHPHLHRMPGIKEIPKGCLAINVGQGKEQERIVMPVVYLNHPLFAHLLKEAEEEYGFDHQGAITIPCQVGEFRYVQSLIDREKSLQHHHNHNHNHNHLVGCFRV